MVARLSILLTASLLALFMAANAAEARTWQDRQGRTIEAEVVRVNPDRTVVMKTESGKVVTVPFDTFSEMDVEHFEFLLSRRGRGKPHPVPWYEMNDLFGLEIWQDDLLWDDSTASAAERIEERVWHDSQKTKRRRNGYVDLHLSLGSLLEIERWVLGWGDAAEVIAPAELRQKITQTVIAMRNQYD